MGLTEARTRELMQQGYDPINEMRIFLAAYKATYGVSTTAGQIRKYAQVLIKDLGGKMPQKEKAQIDPPLFTTEDATRWAENDKEVTTSIGQELVPDQLLANIAEIKRAVDNAGGCETALAVAQMVGRVGGLTNFVRAVKLLSTITPSHPQVVSMTVTEGAS